MTNFTETHLPCPKCDSSDGYSKDADGNGYCFAECGFIKGDSNSPSEVSHKPVEKSYRDLNLDGYFRDLKFKGDQLADRNISKGTCELFNVKVTLSVEVTEESSRETVTSIIFPYYDLDGTLVAQKIRTKECPKGYWVGKKKDITLFGAQRKDSGQRITITEGELDAMAIVEMMGDYPVVSITDGAQTAAQCIAKHRDFFDKFQEIRVCFDDDEPGREAAKKVADILPFGKVKIVKLKKFNDPNDYLKNKRQKDFEVEWWNATDYTPAGIVNGSEFWEFVKEKPQPAPVLYPWDDLNEITYGIRPGELVTLTAGTGVGKSAVVRELIKHIKDNTEDNIGVFMLEESPKRVTSRHLMSLEIDKPLHLPDTEVTEEELQYAFDNSLGTGRLFFFDHFGSNNIDTIVSRIDAMVAGYGCRYIILDHISIIVSDQSHGDERKALDEIATKLRTLVENRNFSLFMVSHLRRPGGKPHEEGGQTSLSDLRGTAAIAQLSDIVLGLERNGQHEDEFLRNVTKIRVLKNRFSGITGLTSYLSYDKTTHRLTEEEPKYIESLEKGTEYDDFKDETKNYEDVVVFDNSDFGTQEEQRNK